MTTSLGVTFACRDGFSADFRLAVTDEEAVADEVYHRLTTDSVLGDTAEAQNWGINLFRRCGLAMSDADIATLGPELAAMLQTSPLVEHADVAVTRLASSPGLVSLQIDVDVTAKNPLTDAAGDSFSFIFRLTGDTFYRVGDPDAGV